MSADQRPRDVWSDLVGGLVDARSDAVSARFDAELAAAVEAGRLSEQTAHRLRFWQRASARAVADHVRAVMPVALGALEAARADARRYADEAADVLGPPMEAPAARSAPEPANSEPLPRPPTNGWRGDVGVVPQATSAPPTAATLARPAVSDTDERRASTHPAAKPSSLGPSSLVILADLTQAEPRT